MAQCLVGNNQPQSVVMPAMVLIITCVRLLIHWLIWGGIHLASSRFLILFLFIKPQSGKLIIPSTCFSCTSHMRC